MQCIQYIYIYLNSKYAKDNSFKECFGDLQTIYFDCILHPYTNKTKCLHFSPVREIYAET